MSNILNHNLSEKLYKSELSKEVSIKDVGGGGLLNFSYKLLANFSEICIKESFQEWFPLGIKVCHFPLIVVVNVGAT